MCVYGNVSVEKDIKADIYVAGRERNADRLLGCEEHVAGRSSGTIPGNRPATDRRGTVVEISRALVQRVRELHEVRSSEATMNGRKSGWASRLVLAAIALTLVLGYIVAGILASGAMD